MKIHAVMFTKEREKSCLSKSTYWRAERSCFALLASFLFCVIIRTSRWIQQSCLVNNRQRIICVVVVVSFVIYSWLSNKRYKHSSIMCECVCMFVALMWNNLYGSRCYTLEEPLVRSPWRGGRGGGENPVWVETNRARTAQEEIKCWDSRTTKLIYPINQNKTRNT